MRNAQAFVICDACGTRFRKSPSAIKLHNFCGHLCNSKWKRTRTRELAGGWKRGELTSSSGRVKVLMPEHPRAGTSGYVYRYHVVAEESLGRDLKPQEVVHHIDFDPTNDNPANLRVYPNESEHQRYHGRLRGGLNRSIPNEREYGV